jgi:hypothetical protein
MTFFPCRRVCSYTAPILVLFFVTVFVQESELSGTASAQIVSPEKLAERFVFASPHDKENWIYRQTHGHYNVVWMHGLVEGYMAGFITQEDLLRELWAERPDRTQVLLDDHGSVTPHFLLDVVYAESNGPIDRLEDGTPVFFDTTQYLDLFGDVIPKFARDYNTAQRATWILREVLDEWYETAGAGDPVLPLNHRCCGNVPEDCETKQDNKRCKMDGATCAAGSHMCNQAHGPEE